MPGLLADYCLKKQIQAEDQTGTTTQWLKGSMSHVRADMVSCDSECQSAFLLTRASDRLYGTYEVIPELQLVSTKRIGCADLLVCSAS